MTILNTIISQTISLNAQELPNTIKILPASPFIGRDGRKFSFDVATILNNFLKNEQQIPIDLDHATELNAPRGISSPAVGWIASIEANEDGSIWGNVDWNRSGEWIIESKKYKYISPAFYVENNQITFLSSIGLTNRPNLKLPALNNREINNKEINTQEKPMEKILNALNLPADATEDSTIAEINSLKEKINNNENEKTGLVKELNSLNSKVNSLLNQDFLKTKEIAINTALEQGRILPATSNYYNNSIKNEADLNSFVEMVKTMPSLTTSLQKPETTEHNSKLTPEQVELCSTYDMDSEKFLSNKKAIFGAENI